MTTTIWVLIIYFHGYGFTMFPGHYDRFDDCQTEARWLMKVGGLGPMQIDSADCRPFGNDLTPRGPRP